MSNCKCKKVIKINEAAEKLRHSKGLKVKNYGVVKGHKDCNGDSFLVPKNMGWLWNIKNPGINKIRRGWKPGAVPKSVARLMNHFLRVGHTSFHPEQETFERPKSTLKVEKKAGEYRIILNPPPIDDKSCGDIETPIVFKISKTNEEMKRFEAINLLKSRGINKECSCENIHDCFCINECRKQIILYELKAISDIMCISPTLKYEELNEDSSEIDFEFTPPFDMMNKCRRDVRVSVAATQYDRPSDDEMNDDGKPCKIKDPCGPTGKIRTGDYKDKNKCDKKDKGDR